MVQPIGGGSLRKFIVQVGDRAMEVTARMPVFGVKFGVVTEPAEHAGAILMPRWEEILKLLSPNESRRSFRWLPSHLRWQLVASVHHALRQMSHILNKYGFELESGEKSAMLEAALCAHELNLAFLGFNPGTSVAAVREDTREAIGRIGSILGKPIKPSKLEAREQVTKLKAGADSRDRVNPSVGMVRSRTIFDRVSERLSEIMTIDPQIESRRKALLYLILLTEQYLEDADDMLKPLLRRDGLRPMLGSRQRLLTAGGFEHHAQQLDRIDFRPYRNAASETSRDLREARDLLRDGQVNTQGLRYLRRLLIKCRSAIAIKREQVEVERLIFILANAEYKAGRFPRVTTEKLAERLQLRLGGTLAQLIGIDEAEFRRPVCRPAAADLMTARKLLSEFLNTKNLRKLKEAREYLKAVSLEL